LGDRVTLSRVKEKSFHYYDAFWLTKMG
jgi:hypothetical protein